MKFNIALIFILFGFLLFSCDRDQEIEVCSTYPDGTPSKVLYFHWEKGSKIYTREIRLLPNGEKEIEGELKNKIKHGKWTYWFENGKKWLVENYKDGQKEGKVTEWFESGEYNYEGKYSKGIPDGKWTFWDGKGNKTRTVIYEMGKTKSSKDEK
jgi:antitoxin component YwqK of YwqJK toxin-antitoxin module